MTEVELKLAVPLAPAARLLRRLARAPALAGCKAHRTQMHNIYFDTPDQALRHQGTVLRLRRVGEGPRAQWLQTLKISSDHDAALSRRGEWESPVPHPVLSRDALADSPWAGIDPDGCLLERLQPCFETRFTRTCWQLALADGGLLEVALDQGHIVVGGQDETIHELELELRAGSVSDLFTVAQELAGIVPLLPLADSKSARAYRLVGPETWMPPKPGGSKGGRRQADLADMARAAFRGAWGEFTRHLCAPGRLLDPEAAHRARVGWRRFNTACTLFRPLLGNGGPAMPPALVVLLDTLGQLRDLDVACTETLPALEGAYVDGDAARAVTWLRMMEGMTAARAQAAADMHRVICRPATGQALLVVTQWLECLDGLAFDLDGRTWALRRIQSLRRKLRDASHTAQEGATQHRQRLLAKRLRYAVDLLQPLLPRQRASHWHRQAIALQEEIGHRRDMALASVLVQRQPGHALIAEFLRGHAGAMQGPPKAGPHARPV